MKSTARYVSLALAALFLGVTLGGCAEDNNKAGITNEKGNVVSGGPAGGTNLPPQGADRNKMSENMNSNPANNPMAGKAYQQSVGGGGR